MQGRQREIVRGILPACSRKQRSRGHSDQDSLNAQATKIPTSLSSYNFSNRTVVQNNSYSAPGPSGGGRKTNLIVHSGIQTAPQQAKEYQLCEGNVIRVMQRISFNMAVKRHNVPNWETNDAAVPPVGTCAIIVRADSRDSSRVSRSSLPRTAIWSNRSLRGHY
jgi:hypothetical protein